MDRCGGGGRWAAACLAIQLQTAGFADEVVDAALGGFILGGGGLGRREGVRGAGLRLGQERFLVVLLGHVLRRVEAKVETRISDVHSRRCLKKRKSEVWKGRRDEA